MPKFKMVHIDAGGEVQVCFLCQHCTVSTPSQLSADSYGQPFQSRFRQSGECAHCEGTGFDPSPTSESRICHHCGGTGVCPYCGGNYLRSWTELPIETQDRFLRNWEREGTYPENYAATPRFYSRAY